MSDATANTTQTTEGTEAEAPETSEGFDPSEYGLEAVSASDLGDPDAPEESEGGTEGDEPETEGDEPETESDEPETEGDGSETEGDEPETEGGGSETEGDEPETEGDGSETEGEVGEKPKKPAVPEGHVPLEALHQARGEIKRLKQEISAMKVQKSESKPDSLISDAEVKEFEDFSILSKAKLAEKFEDDPVGAAEYTEKLSKYYDFKNREAQQKLNDEAASKNREAYETALKQEYEAAANEMEKVLPGLFDEGSTAQEEIAEFAKSIGFEESLFFLTDPSTHVIPADSDTPVPLGTMAADVLKSLVNARTKIAESKPVDTKALEAKIRTKVEKEIRAELEKEVLSKVKVKSKGSGYTSLDDIPTSDVDNTTSGKVLSESEFIRLSPAAQEEYLKGN